MAAIVEQTHARLKEIERKGKGRDLYKKRHAISPQFQLKLACLI